jgi:hypothetical protein
MYDVTLTEDLDSFNKEESITNLMRLLRLLYIRRGEDTYFDELDAIEYVLKMEDKGI